jgi:hypothetical protein
MEKAQHLHLPYHCCDLHDRCLSVVICKYIYYNASTLFKSRCLYAYAEIRIVNAATALTISVDDDVVSYQLYSVRVRPNKQFMRVPKGVDKRKNG